jgi:putative spermidine/putrescine transport system ATP-binding protein
MQYELKHIHESVGVTIVYVTHDQGEALTMSDRIAVFNEGLIQQLAPPSEVYEQPDNAFVAQFIGENNRLMGTVESIRDDQCSVRIEGGQQIVQARAVNNGPAGSRTTLSLRPESVKINPEGSGYSERFEARVEELIYLGDHTRVRVSVLQHDDFIIKVPRTDDAPVLQVGHTCTVAWQAKDCRALDATQD